MTTKTDRPFRIKVTYPMPYKEATDDFLHAFPGWYGSGFDGSKRDNVLDASFDEVCNIISASTSNWIIEISSH